MRRHTTHRRWQTTHTHSTTARLAVSATLLVGFLALLAATTHTELAVGLTVGLLAARTLRTTVSVLRDHHRTGQRTHTTETGSQLA